MTLWVLGDQLNHAAVRRLAPKRVLLIEAYELGRTPPMHPQKLVLFFSAMRHFAKELREVGWEVIERVDQPNVTCKYPCAGHWGPMLVWVEICYVTQALVLALLEQAM